MQIWSLRDLPAGCFLLLCCGVPPEVVGPVSPSVVSEPSPLTLAKLTPSLALGCSGGEETALTQELTAQAGQIQLDGCCCREGGQKPSARSLEPEGQGRALVSPWRRRHKPQET